MRIIKEKKIKILLFAAISIPYFCWLFSLGEMISASGDAADIWRTITTWYEQDTYVSYVLYKGFSAVYPYVWLYQLAMLLRVNEFTFVMAFNAVLLAYILTIGIPHVIEELTTWKPKVWQIFVMSLYTFFAWKNTYALNQLSIDLPSCAVFILSIDCTINLRKKDKLCLWGGLAGVLSGLCTEYSGQYALTGICILLFAIMSCNSVSCSNRKKMEGYLSIVVSFASIKALGFIFDHTILLDVTNGLGVATGGAWLKRGLIYMLNMPRMGDLHSARGDAILWDLYGTLQGTELLDLAARGGYSWTIKEYISVVCKYPFDFILQYVDRFFLCLSVDKDGNSFHSLFCGYALVYMAVQTIVKQNGTWKHLFNRKNLIILGALVSVVPVVVLTVEPRYAYGLQSIVWGLAICGPCIPHIMDDLRDLAKRRIAIGEFGFPWHILLGVLFCLLCIAFYNSFFCQTYSEANMILMHW